MQPVNLAVAAELDVAPELEVAPAPEAVAGLEAVEAGVVLLPHAPISRVAAPAAIVAANEVCFIRSSTGPDSRHPGMGRFSRAQISRRLNRRRI
jgi:hypothetical protein